MGSIRSMQLTVLCAATTSWRKKARVKGRPPLAPCQQLKTLRGTATSNTRSSLLLPWLAVGLPSAGDGGFGHTPGTPVVTA